MGLKGRYVCTPFETINEFEIVLARLVLIRTCPKINVYLSEDFVFLVPSGYCQGVSKLPRVPLEIEEGTTMIQTWKLDQYPRLQR